MKAGLIYISSDYLQLCFITNMLPSLIDVSSVDNVFQHGKDFHLVVTVDGDKTEVSWEAAGGREYCPVWVGA